MDVTKQLWYATAFGVHIAPPSAFCTRAEYESQDWPRTRMGLAIKSFRDDCRDYQVMRARAEAKTYGAKPAYAVRRELESDSTFRRLCEVSGEDYWNARA